MIRVLSNTLPTLALLLIGLLGFATGAQAQTFQEGVNYAVIEPPVSTQAAEGKVEVAEVFWYGCPHCYNLEPVIGTYLKQKPDYVEFARIPAMISPNWAFHGKLFYVGRMLDPDGSKDVHTKIFEAIHKQRRRIGNDDQLRRFFEGLGFKTADINNAMKSMELQTKLAYARDIAEKSRLDSVPTIIVNGKYLTSPSMVTAGGNLIDIIQYLTRLEHKP
ncbi:MAG: thiol:disulfide interchange protein DsbA/DsbL [Thiolinea sp.]